jgi:hypothetical protein
MKNQNWFKIKLQPEDYITEQGKTKTKVGIQDVLNGVVKAKYLPPMINKVARYISREDNACQGKSKGAERACRRFYVTARIVKQFLEDELNEVKQ